jgi:hypothetical protein
VVEAIDNSPANIYIQSIELNGKKYDSSNLSHSDITQGGRMIIRMGKQPNYNFGKSTQSSENAQTSEFLNTPFRHPGMAQSRGDLNSMKQMILAGKEPWETAFENLKKQVSLDFQPSPVAYVSVGPYEANSMGGREYERSANAAYQHALM